MGPTRCVLAMHADGTRFPVAASISCGGEGDERLYTAILREIPEDLFDADAPASLQS
jgi:hypothetical protein